MLNRLSEQGFKLSIDDFARAIRRWRTSRLPVDELKIDKSFRDGHGSRGKDDAMIVRSTIDLAHNLA